MKFWNKFLKVLGALAAVAAIVYVVINYGDKIVCWTKKTVAKYFPCCCNCSEEEFAEEFATEDLADEADFEV